MTSEKRNPPGRLDFGGLFGKHSQKRKDSDDEKGGNKPEKWSMGVLNDKYTIEVPGSVLLLAEKRNEPLGLRNAPARMSHSSLPTGYPPELLTPGGSRPIHEATPASPEADDRKKTGDGAIILEPQPDDSANDPLNWPAWRRDSSLLSLGFYCMVGGGIAPILAAGFNDVADDFGVHTEEVALTVGMYMLGLGVGSVVASPTAILFGKRPVYLASGILFIATSIWCAASPSFTSLVVARVFQGMSVSPVECLPSATIAEIFFLHERAFRIGIYTLLLLGGKNLVPLVSAAVIGAMSWRWVFWITAMVVGACLVLLFFMVPETFWDRTPVPRSRKVSRRPSFMRRRSSRGVSTTTLPRLSMQRSAVNNPEAHGANAAMTPGGEDVARPVSPGAALRAGRNVHVGFAPGFEPEVRKSHASPRRTGEEHTFESPQSPETSHHHHKNLHVGFAEVSDLEKQAEGEGSQTITAAAPAAGDSQGHGETHASSSRLEPSVAGNDQSQSPMPSVSRPSHGILSPASPRSGVHGKPAETSPDYFSTPLDTEKLAQSRFNGPPKAHGYTQHLRHMPAKTFVQQLKPFNGRLNHDNWFKVMLRPFVLFTYPAVLWSAIIYACSVGWLIVLSESMAIIYRDPDTYNFTAMETGLVYISPFIGGILGTGVAGKISDIIVKAMSKRNGGLYEPEFRLVMAIPILFSTCIGLMGFGWSAEEENHWAVPTVFFGIISFGCSLGSTTAITFCVDSYRQYAGEALVTLNFAKNIFHGLVFSLFFTHWLVDDGPKMVFIWIGIIQLICILFTIPMFIYGKRARMWTVRKNRMEKL